MASTIANSNVDREEFLTTDIDAKDQGNDVLEANEAEEFPVSITSSLSVTSQSHFRYHIVYHDIYRVPVLFFQCDDGYGKVVTNLERVLTMLQVQEHPHTVDDFDWTFITQLEHCVLGTPFFCLHPCRTAKVMSLLNTNITHDEKVSKTTRMTIRCVIGEQGLNIDEQVPSPEEVSTETLGPIQNDMKSSQGNIFYLQSWISLLGQYVGLHTRVCPEAILN